MNTRTYRNPNILAAITDVLPVNFSRYTEDKYNKIKAIDWAAAHQWKNSFTTMTSQQVHAALSVKGLSYCHGSVAIALSKVVSTNTTYVGFCNLGNNKYFLVR